MSVEMGTRVVASPAPSPLVGRLLILAAAVLWSLSGAFSNILTQPTALNLDVPKLDSLQIAAGRVLFAGLVMVPLVRRRDFRFRWATLWTALTFTAMNALYITAMTQGKAANAVLLQYTAPVWVFLVGIFLLGEKVEHRGVVALLAGVLGMAVILAGGERDQMGPILLGIVSGVTFAGILLGLRAQRDASPAWLTAVNHLTGALLLLPFALPWLRADLPWPTWPQVAWLALFGALQLGFPYLLMARGLKSVSPQEAGALTLVEPLLVPVWAYFVAPQKEALTGYILVGGAIILFGLAYRYWPAPRQKQL